MDLDPDTLPPRAICVRGGLMGDHQSVFDSAVDSNDDDDGFALSVFCADPDIEGSREAALSRAVKEGEIPNSQVRVTTVGQLTAEGFVLVPRPPPPCHWHVILGTVPSIDRVSIFIGLFGEPEPSPREKRSSA